MGNCECGRLKGNPCGPLRPNTINVTMPHIEPEPDEMCAPDDTASVRGVPTLYFRDVSRSILSSNTSPDVPFNRSVNPYRGCEHGCIYCYARPTHEYLGLSAGLDFETRIFVKPRAPELLRAELSRRSWTPQVLAMSGVTDPYQPIERRLQLTRGCLAVLAEFLNPVGVEERSRHPRPSTFWLNSPPTTA